MRRMVPVGKGWMIAAVALLALVAAGAVQARMGTSTSPSSRESTMASRATSDRAAPSGQVPTPGADVAGDPSSKLADPRNAAGSAAATASSGGSGGSAGAAVGPSNPGSTGPAVVPDAPKVVRSADLRVKVGKGGFGDAFDRAASIAAANGGFVSASSTSAVEESRSGELTVRVPSDRFDAARQGLGGLGNVESQSIRGEDVSGQLVDQGALLKSLQAQEDALRVLVGQAKTVGEVLQVQSSLFNVRQQIEQLTAQKANLDQSATLATIKVSLFEPGAAAVVRPVAKDGALAHRLAQAVDGMLAVMGGMIVVVGWLVPVSLLGFLVWGGSRLRRRRPAPPAPAV